MDQCIALLLFLLMTAILCLGAPTSTPHVSQNSIVTSVDSIEVPVTDPNNVQDKQSNQNSDGMLKNVNKPDNPIPSSLNPPSISNADTHADSVQTNVNEDTSDEDQKNKKKSQDTSKKNGSFTFSSNSTLNSSYTDSDNKSPVHVGMAGSLNISTTMLPQSEQVSTPSSSVATYNAEFVAGQSVENATTIQHSVQNDSVNVAGHGKADDMNNTMKVTPFASGNAQVLPTTVGSLSNSNVSDTFKVSLQNTSIPSTVVSSVKGTVAQFPPTLTPNPATATETHLSTLLNDQTTSATAGYSDQPSHLPLYETSTAPYFIDQSTSHTVTATESTILPQFISTTLETASTSSVTTVSDEGGKNRKRPPLAAAPTKSSTTSTTATSTKATTTTTTATKKTTTKKTATKETTTKTEASKSSTPSIPMTTKNSSKTGNFWDKARTYWDNTVKKYGTTQVAAVVSVAILATVFVIFVICRICNRRRYSRFKTRKLKEYGQEKEFLLTEQRGGHYNTDRLTLLEGSSEDEF